MEKERRGSEKEQDIHEIDKKRVLIAVLILGIVLGAGLMWGKDVDKKIEQKTRESGEVAGQTDINFDQLQQQIDEIKKDVSGLKAEDLAKQKPVQKILDDLEELKKKTSESAKVFDVKGNLCEEAKRRFCE